MLKAPTLKPVGVGVGAGKPAPVTVRSDAGVGVGEDVPRPPKPDGESPAVATLEAAVLEMSARRLSSPRVAACVDPYARSPTRGMTLGEIVGETLVAGKPVVGGKDQLLMPKLVGVLLTAKLVGV